MSPKAE
jgi:prepilin peptidase CpaA